MFPLDSCLWTSGLETLYALTDGVMRRLRTPRSLFLVFRHSLRHAAGSSCGVLEANQDGGPLGEGGARVLGPHAERPECCPAVPRVRGRRAAGRPLGSSPRDLRGRKGPQAGRAGPGDSLEAGLSGSKALD